MPARDVETALGTRWAVWVGGIALALGGLFLIRYTIESDGRKITQARIDTPRQLDRLLARTLLSGALIDNTVAIIASIDSCTACAER